MPRKHPVLREYDAQSDACHDFTKKLSALVAEIMHVHGIPVHSISDRTKTRTSVTAKITQDPKYRTLNDVTDICGVRIVTYFADDVDRVAAIVEKEFVIDWQNSIDKRAALDADRFGYLSLHYVLT